MRGQLTPARSSLPTTDLRYDPYPGDIRNAQVSFVCRDSAGCLGVMNGVNIVSGLPVGLVSSSDTKTGTATYNWTGNISSCPSSPCSQLFAVGIIVTNYYSRNNSYDDTVITVSQPGTNFITGGGYIALASPSGLAAAGTTGTKNNFGFNVKYNKQGTNLQGNINTIVRSSTCVAGLNCQNPAPYVYQIKGNSMTSLSLQPSPLPTNCTLTPPCSSTFNGKASIQDITNPLNVISIDGNATLQVDMTDNGEPGTLDTIGITVWNKSGGMWFSSNWNGTKTVQQNLAGGDLMVH